MLVEQCALMHIFLLVGACALIRMNTVFLTPLSQGNVHDLLVCHLFWAIDCQPFSKLQNAFYF